MKIALVHDYLKEFGGAERVLRCLADLYPEAPIYTAFCYQDSAAGQAFADHPIIESPWSKLIKPGRLYSPLRFLLPRVWGSLDLSEFDLVITSCSGYIARGFKISPKTKVLAYCHTPPRFLYGYRTSVDWQKYWPIRLYGRLINHFLRQFDWCSSRQVDRWLVNSNNVRRRVEKFYHRSSHVVYPPVMVERLIAASQRFEKQDYFLIVSRLVGAKGLEEAVVAMRELDKELKIVGGTAGYNRMKNKLVELGGDKVTFTGRVSDEKLCQLYAQAKGFIALAQDEDFGITPVEAQAAGTPVLAYNGGGFKESVKDGKTGVLIDDVSVAAVRAGLERFNQIGWHKKEIQNWARQFGKARFKEEIKQQVQELLVE